MKSPDSHVLTILPTGQPRRFEALTLLASTGDLVPPVLKEVVNNVRVEAAATLLP